MIGVFRRPPPRQRRRLYTAVAPAPNVNIGVDFDGVDQSYTRGAGLTGAADGDEGTVSFWFNSSVGGQRFFSDFNDNFRIEWGGSGQVRIVGIGATVTRLDLRSSTGLADGQWHHCAAAWNASTAHLYIDGVDDATVTTHVAGNIDYTSTNWYFARPAAALFYDGCIGEFWFDLNYMDLSNSSNRLKFLAADGSRPSLGATGNIPTGTAPIVYCSGPPATFGNNFGTGGAFTQNGSPTSCAIADLVFSVEGSISVAVSMGGSADTDAQLAAAMALAVEHGISADIVATLAAASSFSVDAGATASSDATLEGSASMTVSYSASEAAQMAGEAAVSIAVTKALSASGGLDLSAAIVAALGAGSTANAEISIEAAVGVVVNAGVAAEVIATLEPAVSIGVVGGLVASALADLSAQVAAGADFGALAASGATLEGGLSLSVQFDYTATGTTGVIVVSTPLHRVLTIQMDDRTLTISQDDRTVTIH